jgi:hypothetical protein
MISPEIRLGSTRVIFVEGRRFLFEDAHRSQYRVEIDDADVPELIQFLHESSRIMGQRHVEIRPIEETRAK